MFNARFAFKAEGMMNAPFKIEIANYQVSLGAALRGNCVLKRVMTFERVFIVFGAELSGG